MRGHTRGLALTCVIVVIVCFISTSMTKAKSPSLQMIQKRALPNKLEILREKISTIERNCFLNMKGLDCPGSQNDQSFKSSLLRSSSSTASSTETLPIVAGVGYSKMEHSIKPQILKSPQGVRISGQEKLVTKMNGAAEYFGMLYPKDGSPIFNGLFSHGASATDMVFSQYFKGDLYAMDYQKQYFTHNVELTTIQVTPEFQQIIDILPDQMDESMYKLVISSFGESIATKVKYGGVVDMTVSIRSCFSDPQMQSYLEKQLQLTINNSSDTSSLPSGYMRYHKIGSLDIVGGNPQISVIQKRVETFAKNPVPVRLELTPIWRAFPAGAKQENMKKIYNQHIASMNTEISKKVSDLEAKKKADKLKAQPVYAYKIDSKTGYVSKFGSEIQVSTAAPVEIPEVINSVVYRQIPMMGHLRRFPLGILAMTPIVHRKPDGTFFFDFKYGNCDLKHPTSCKYPGTVPYKQMILTSATGKDQCVKLKFQETLISGYPIGGLIVCTGCMPFVSANFKDVTCQCPFIN